MSTGPLRLVIAGLVLILLARAALGAWHHRRLAMVVWRTMGLRHVAGAFGLFAIVAIVASLLLMSPPLRFGLGSLVGFSGNAVFTPLEEITARSGQVGAQAGFDWYVVGIASAFLGFIALLLPWLAFVEEEIFRGGLEKADLRQELVAALRFGLVHLIMLVPIAAALAIAVAGFCYGRIYRRAYHSDAHTRIPEVVARTYRPTPRARRSAMRAPCSETAPPLARPQVRAAAMVERESGGASWRRSESWSWERSWLAQDCDKLAQDATEPGGTDGSTGAIAPSAPTSPRLRQAAGVLASTVWHATFNSLVLVLLWLVLVFDAATR